MAKDLVAAPALTPEGSLSRYLAEIRKFPMLAKDEEYMLAKRYAEHEDPEAAAQLVDPAQRQHAGSSLRAARLLRFIRFDRFLIHGLTFPCRTTALRDICSSTPSAPG